MAGLAPRRPPRRKPPTRPVRVLGTGVTVTAETRPRAKPAPLVQSEKSYMAQIVKLATLRGWRSYHPLRSEGSAAGFPDLVLVRRPRCVWAEIKRDGAHPTPAQRAWLDELGACGAEVYLWRPSDFEEVKRVLR